MFEEDTIISEDSRRSLNSSEEVRSLLKTSEVVLRRPKSSEDVWSFRTRIFKRARFKCFSLQKSEITRKELSFIHFTHGFRSLHGFELHIFGSCVNQVGNNSYFWIRREKLTHRREPAWDQSFQPVGVRLTPKAWELAGIQLHDLHVVNDVEIVTICTWGVFRGKESKFTCKLVSFLTSMGLSSNKSSSGAAIGRNTG